jgi:hypothetical protein
MGPERPSWEDALIDRRERGTEHRAWSEAGTMRRMESDGPLERRPGLRARVGRVTQRLLGYRPPPPARPRPEHAPRTGLRWLASAGGIGGLEVYSYGVALGILLVIAIVWVAVVFSTNPGGPADDEDTWAPVATVLLLLALYFALAGFVASRRTGKAAVGALVGAVTALIGLGTAALTVTVVELNGLFLFLAIPLIGVLVPLGAGCGAMGGAVARPREAARALWEGLSEVFTRG